MLSSPRQAESDARSSRVRSFERALTTQWRSLGSVGRLACVGLALSAAVAVALGLSIQNGVRRHLLEVRAGVLQHIVDEFAAEELMTPGDGRVAAQSRLLEAVERRLIGGEVVAVSVRDSDGEVLHAEPRQHATPSAPPAVAMPHVEQHPDGGLLHFQLAVAATDGPTVGSVEVLQQPTSLNEFLRRVRRNVWLSIITGLGSLAAAMGALTLSSARVIEGRQRHAEQLLRELLRAEDDERHRIVGALHDDVGQPLYRVLYGLEGSRARLGDGSLVAAELDKLATLVRQVDDTLRLELHRLHRRDPDGLELAAALDAIASDCRTETGELRVDVEVDPAEEPSSVARAVLLRAVQEAVMNVRRHAAASRLRIRVHEQAGAVVIEVLDDGCGIASPYGLGLTTTAERLEALGGGLEVHAGLQGGTVFRAWAPCGAAP
jgi:signal transduction histidine kinase